MKLNREPIRPSGVISRDTFFAAPIAIFRVEVPLRIELRVEEGHDRRVVQRVERDISASLVCDRRNLRSCPIQW